MCQWNAGRVRQVTDLQKIPAYARFRYMFSERQRADFPNYPGSAWRGAFGRALRDAVCVTGQESCDQCLLKSNCTYQYLFETRVEGTTGKGINTYAPHPFVLELTDESPTTNRRRQHIVGVNLIGDAIALLPSVTIGLARAAEHGIAGTNNRMALEAVEQYDGAGWHVVYRKGNGGLQPLRGDNRTPEVPSGPVGINFSTPLRVKRRGSLVGVEGLSPRVLIHELCARFARLVEFADGDPSALEPWPSIPHSREFLAKELRWIDIDRYSSRQRRKHKIGGLIGSVTLDLSDMEGIWPLLWHGQYLHLGKLTSMGHGAYRIKDPNIFYSPCI